MSLDHGPSWSVRAALSADLSTARQQAKKTPADIHAHGICSPAKLWRIENEVGPWKVSDMTALGLFYGVPTMVRALWEEMARATKDPKPATSWDDGEFSLYERLEAGALALRAKTADLIHGLVQTRSHHEAMLMDWPLDNPQNHASVVQARQERQVAFWKRPDARMELVMSEAALRHRTGTPAIMREQIEHLRTLADRPGVSILVIPVDSRPHGAMLGDYNIIETPQGTCVYFENINGGRIEYRTAQVARFTKAADQAVAVARDVREWQ